MFHVEHKGKNMNEKYMKEAIKLSKIALKNNEMPVGAVVVYENKIIGKGYNKKEKENDPIMHAEIIAIKKASKHIGDWRLNKCSIYITMEPCIMCLGAIIESRIPEVYCGIKNKKTNLLNKKLIKTNNLIVKYGVFDKEIIEITEKFFKTIRNR
jgi:tRNA(adenine34) deaminase